MLLTPSLCRRLSQFLGTLPLERDVYFMDGSFRVIRTDYHAGRIFIPQGYLCIDYPLNLNGVAQLGLMSITKFSPNGLAKWPPGIALQFWLSAMDRWGWNAVYTSGGA